MYHRPSKQALLIRRILTYALMVIAVVAIVLVCVLFILGYRPTLQGTLQQGALVQFGSRPGGAVVQVDGKSSGISGNTPTKALIDPGEHNFTIAKQGYDTWSKTLKLTAGTLTWLDYARLIPASLPVSSVEKYPTLTGALASPNQSYMLVQQDATQPNFSLVSLKSDTVSQETVSLPDTVITDFDTPNTAHSFKIVNWDGGSRYVLIQHTYGPQNQSEWLVLDTQSPKDSKNITTDLNVTVSQVKFAGSNGQEFYAVDGSGSLRKLDLGADTISRALVQHVSSYNLYQNSIISYVGADDQNLPIVGLYRDGDDATHVLKTGIADQQFFIAYAEFYNNAYVAIASDTGVSILEGSFPSSASDNSSLKQIATMTTPSAVTALSFAPSGQYVLAQAGSQFNSYDVEYKRPSTAAVHTSSARPLEWLDNAYLWTDSDNSLTLREFDGTNVHAINPVATGFDATLAQSGKWLYSFDKTTTGYQLQRVRLILQ